MTACATTPPRRSERLAQSVDRIHFDEAWYGYARFNPMYARPLRDARRSGQHPQRRPDGVRDALDAQAARRAVADLLHPHPRRPQRDRPRRFNEAYCSQASTSPLYALIASNDVAAAMMDGPAGQALTQETIDEAVACRLALARARSEFKAKKRMVLRALERRRSARSEQRQAHRRSSKRRRKCSPRIRAAGSCIRARAGTASKACRTAGACSIRSRSASSARA